jgi:hypothetical protein
MAWYDDIEFKPPKHISYIDDLIVIDPTTGEKMEFWKSLALSGTALRHRIEARADSAPVTPARDEDLPPPVVADAQPDRAEELRQEFQMHCLLAKIERFEQRIEALEKRKRANDVLLALEAAEPPGEPDQDRKLN